MSTLSLAEPRHSRMTGSDRVNSINRKYVYLIEITLG